jgi:putative aldouronate transport system permease protein
MRVVVGTVSGLFCTSMLSYLVSVRSFSARRPLRIFFLITMYFGGGFIPTYLLFIQLNLLNTFTVYWLPYLFNAYYMLIIASYIQNLPYALVESALIDGSNYLKIFLRIIIPMSVPVLAAIAVFLAVNQWNAWFDNMIYNSNGNWDTVQIILKRMMLEADINKKLTLETQAAQRMYTRTATTVKAACTMVITIPILMTYPFFQRYFISGITLGAVKE